MEHNHSYAPSVYSKIRHLKTGFGLTFVIKHFLSVESVEEVGYAL